MKKLIIYLLLVTLCVGGYAYNKETLLKIGGDEVNVPLGFSEGIKGKGLKGIIYRAVSVAFPAKYAIKELKDIKTTSTKTGDESSSSIDIIK